MMASGLMIMSVLAAFGFLLITIGIMETRHREHMARTDRLAKELELANQRCLAESTPNGQLRALVRGLSPEGLLQLKTAMSEQEFCALAQIHLEENVSPSVPPVRIVVPHYPTFTNVAGHHDSIVTKGSYR